MQNMPVPENEKQNPKRLIGKLAAVIALTVIYFFAGKLGLSLAFVNPSATAVWPPAGIALAAFLILGDYVWPAILLGAFLVNFTTSGSALPSLGIAMGNTIEGLVGAYLVNRYAHGSRAFARAQDVLKFTILAGLFGTVISATIGVTSLVWGGLAPQSDILAVWLTWLLGDATGILIVAPLLILWAGGSKLAWTPARVAEAVFMLSSSVLVALVIFSNQSLIGATNYSLEFLIVPWIIWAAFRFNQRETASVTAVISAIAIVSTLRGLGPFAQALPNESLLLLQGFMSTVAITGLILAALVSERHEIESALRESNDRLRFGVNELQQHNDKMILLNEMGDLLQSCAMAEDAYTIINQYGERLFPEESGAVYMINNSRNIVEIAVVWGKHPPRQDIFTLNECWALRRGRIHLLNEGGLELLCPHLTAQPPLAALCIPMMAHGETMGILHLQSGLASPDQPHQEQAVINEIQLQLAKAMADTSALALANLKLRVSLHDQSIRDPLTDLFNRRYLEETLEREIHRAARLQRSVAVIMMDIDHFKRFNDTFSHEAGDTLLRELGVFLKRQIRGGDFACRYGGEEFILILPEISLEDLRQSAERLRKKVKELHIQYAGEVLEAITLSLGIALFPVHGTTGKAVVHAADEALYEAKHQGRDRVVVALSTAEEPPEPST
jgi:diguanylate cyclase (GGDEF)-like protein